MRMGPHFGDIALSGDALASNPMAMRFQVLTRDQLIQWSKDGLAILLQNEIFISIMTNGISKGIQQGGPPISDRATTGVSILRISNVTAWQFQLAGTSA